jgi:hypothetical protein
LNTLLLLVVVVAVGIGLEAEAQEVIGQHLGLLSLLALPLQ